MDPRTLRRIGPYPVRRFIAEGGMAWVFEVVDPRFDARRALKMLKPQAAAGEEFRRFEAEAKLLARLDHPNLITIYDFGRDEETGCDYFTMTLVEGPSLADRCPLPLEEAGPLLLDVLAGLARLHEAGIVHRDIKPANMLLTGEGRALLADLGIARSAAEEASHLTQTGTAIGTVTYMSPEQARARPAGPESDVFSMGLSIYQVLTGRRVYDDVEGLDSASSQDVLLYLGSLLHAGRELDLRFPPEMPPAIRRVIRRACRFDPAARYPGAAAMHDALADALDDPYAAEEGRGLGGTLARAGLAAALAGALAGGGWWLWSGREPAPGAPPAAEGAAGAPEAAAEAEEAPEASEAAPAPEEDAPRAGVPEAEPAEEEAAAAEGAAGAGEGGSEPPRTVARRPEAERVRARRGEPFGFSVEARDPEGEALRYRWSVDGRPLEASGPEIEIPIESDARVEVAVRDPSGAEATERWSVVVANRSPELSLAPSESPVVLRVGEERSFRASARDPDGDALRTAFFLDGERVAEGERYAFRASEAGRFELRARATDAQGAETALERTIVVEPQAEAGSQPARSATPEPVLPADPDAAAKAALREYQAAYEARDLDRLTRIWVMNPSQRDAYRRMFEEADRISVEIERESVQVSDDVVSVDFRQHVELEGARLVGSGAESAMTATLIRHGERSWRISSILPRR